MSACANILYRSNICYKDDYLEEVIQRIASELINSVDENYISDQNVILFWDGFGFNKRGLAQIYLKALCKIKKVVYVTFLDRKDKICDIQRTV